MLALGKLSVSDDHIYFCNEPVNEDIAVTVWKDLADELGWVFGYEFPMIVCLDSSDDDLNDDDHPNDDADQNPFLAENIRPQLILGSFFTCVFLTSIKTSSFLVDIITILVYETIPCLGF